MSRNAQAIIDVAALQHNLSVVRHQLLAKTRVLTVVKADAYGHGLVPCARALSHSDGFGVATFEEALTLRDAGIRQPIVLMEGALNVAELTAASRLNLDCVVHHQWQLDQLLAAELPEPVTIWLKVNTGMHRLGVPMTAAEGCWQRLRASNNVKELVLMSHLACADEPEHPLTEQQAVAFEGLCARLAQDGEPPLASLANSAGVMRGARWHYQWVRPGLMLYGACPWLDATAETMGLKPVMQLESTVIAVNSIPKGAAVGYGATWQAPEDMLVAVVSIGYGDGYPRHLSSQAQVLINGERCPLVGRVSMDMITVDVSNQVGIAPGTQAILWGDGLPVEEVAAWAGTVNYELLCQVTPRVKRIYQTGAESR